MSNSQIPEFCNLNPDWFMTENNEKMYYFIDDNLNPRVSKFKKNKERVSYNLETKKGSFDF